MSTHPEVVTLITAANVMPDLAEWLREMASEVDNLGTGDGFEVLALKGYLSEKTPYDVIREWSPDDETEDE